MHKRSAWFLGAAIVAVGTLAVAQSSIKPGQYEMTVEMQMPGAPRPMKTTAIDCVSPDEAKNFIAVMRKDFPGVKACTLTEPVVSGGKISWETTCSGTTVKSEVTITSEGYEGVIRSVVEGNILTANTKGRWVSATCTDK